MPPDARAELLQPRRGRYTPIPPGPPQKPSWLDLARSWWHPALGWLLALVAVVAVYAIISWTQPTPAARARALQESADRSREVEQKAAKALEALKSSPSPAPVVQPKPASTPSRVVPVQTPRAMLVKLPLPRAQLVKLPERKIDEARLLLMPYGQQVVGTLRGFLGSEAQLPRIGHIGDTWIVNNVRWIWITEPGTSAPTWVDP